MNGLKRTSEEADKWEMNDTYRKALVGEWPANDLYEPPIRPDRTLCSYCLESLGSEALHVLRHTKRRENVPVHIPCHAAILDGLQRYPHPRALQEWLDREDVDVRHFNFMGA